LAAANEVLSDKDIAKSYRSQADSMYKEAARLRKEADDLDPPAKKAAKAKEAEMNELAMIIGGVAFVLFLVFVGVNELMEFCATTRRCGR